MDVKLTCKLLSIKDLALFHPLFMADSSTFAPVYGHQLDLGLALGRRPATGWTSSQPTRLTLSWNRELVPCQPLGENCPRSIRPRE